MHLAGWDLEFGKVGEPFFIRGHCTEVSIDEVFRRRARVMTSFGHRAMTTLIFCTSPFTLLPPASSNGSASAAYRQEYWDQLTSSVGSSGQQIFDAQFFTRLDLLQHVNKHAITVFDSLAIRRAGVVQPS